MVLISPGQRLHFTLNSRQLSAAPLRLPRAQSSTEPRHLSPSPAHTHRLLRDELSPSSEHVFRPRPPVRLENMAGGSEGREFSFLTAWCMKLFPSLVVRQRRVEAEQTVCGGAGVTQDRGGFPGRSDLRYLYISLLLKELPRDVMVSYRGWDWLSMREESFSFILLGSVSSCQQLKCCCPRQTIPKKMADATTESRKVFRGAPALQRTSSPEQTQYALAFLKECTGMIDPVQFVVQLVSSAVTEPKFPESSRGLQPV
ncbi:unnamed protein product [Pleuronectes platessa]|uniref:Uncharacterized protein n=1 Tax=Pleuronectes platessa TaxID=8262 RepID=A0A9N7ZBL9_PLEPL|nr:unnamed protein product [Pleuronectes platessa]